ncbi:MAG: hypothetical protein EPN39_15235 [Chitinophagaceae bacterium]|nr:MAG: hypothetical protein EPN39_15235 [Chitinophagaceae bacterium]
MMKIDQHNYEEYLLSYIDDELDEADVTVLIQFLQQHPDKQKELELLQLSKLPVEKGIIFPNKQLLYHKENFTRGKISFMHSYKWIAAVAAACIALFLIIHPFSRKDSGIPNAVVANTPPQKAIQPLQEALQPDSGPPIKREIKQKGNAIPVIAKTNIKEDKKKENYIERKEKDLAAIHNNLMAISQAPPDIPVLQPLNTPTVVIQGKAPVMVAPAEHPEAERAIASKVNKPHQIALSPTLANTVANTVQSLAVAKEDIDSAITRKMTYLNHKKAGLIEHVAKNGIRIGKVTIAFNE